MLKRESGPVPQRFCPVGTRRHLGICLCSSSTGDGGQGHERAQGRPAPTPPPHSRHTSSFTEGGTSEPESRGSLRPVAKVCVEACGGTWANPCQPPRLCAREQKPVPPRADTARPPHPRGRPQDPARSPALGACAPLRDGHALTLAGAGPAFPPEPRKGAAVTPRSRADRAGLSWSKKRSGWPDRRSLGPAAREAQCPHPPRPTAWWRGLPISLRCPRRKSPNLADQFLSRSQMRPVWCQRLRSRRARPRVPTPRPPCWAAARTCWCVLSPSCAATSVLFSGSTDPALPCWSLVHLRLLTFVRRVWIKALYKLRCCRQMRRCNKAFLGCPERWELSNSNSVLINTGSAFPSVYSS